MRFTASFPFSPLAREAVNDTGDHMGRGSGRYPAKP
jgi:hypothetical protein